MAHEVETAAYADNPAWHRVGTVVQGAMSVEEVAQLAGIDWEVTLRQTYVNAGGSLVKVPDRFAVIRTSDNSVLGSVGRFYRPIQTLQAINFMDHLRTSGQVEFEAAGSLAGGRRIWLLARIPKEIRIGGSRDLTFPYLFLTTSHDGSSTCKILPTAVRVVCANTERMAWWSRDPSLTVSIRHVGNVDSKISLAQEVLGLSVNMADLYGDTMNMLAEEDGLPLVEPFLAAMFPPKEVEDGAEVKEDKRRNEAVNGVLTLYATEPQSGWGLLNATTAWVDHVRTPTGVRDGRYQPKDESELLSQLVGKGADIKAQAADILLNLTGIYERQTAELDQLKARVKTFRAARANR